MDDKQPRKCSIIKKAIVALFAVLAVLCALLSRRVKVDYDMMNDTCPRTRRPPLPWM